MNNDQPCEILLNNKKLFSAPAGSGLTVIFNNLSGRNFESGRAPAPRWCGTTAYESYFKSVQSLVDVELIGRLDLRIGDTVVRTCEIPVAMTEC